MSGPARLIALDWGTTSLRAYLLDDQGDVIDVVSNPSGIMAVQDGDFARALDTAIGAWRSRHPDLPIVAAGMIGSAQGWRDIPYVDCPAALDDLVAAMKRQSLTADCPLPIVPGVALRGAFPNVMRGEETQIVGALELRPQLGADCVLVLPGTHSKWVTMRGGRIVDFTTYMTGELFGVLGRHSILGRPARDAGAGEPDATVFQGVFRVASQVAAAAFEQGVLTIRDNPSRGLSSMLFLARALVLSGQLPAAFSLDFLSGLLVGEELRCGLAELPASGGAGIALIGETALCAHYVRALGLFGIAKPPIIEGAAAAGLWRIAAAAGIGSLSPTG
jgi:2-dehydro-3-deoxygalactonokinase